MVVNEDTNKWLVAEFKSVQLQLASIKEQTGKTEGKTNEIDRSMQSMLLALTQHIYECPTRKEFDLLKDENEAFKKISIKLEVYEHNYKTIFISIAVAISGMLLGAFLIISNVNDAINTNAAKIKSIAIMKEANDQLKSSSNETGK